MTEPVNETGYEPLAIRMPAPPRGTETIPTAFSTIVNWDYTVQAPKLRNLYEKSKEAMWNAQTHIDWTLDVDPEAQHVPNEMIPIFGSHLWDRLDKERELPKLRRLQQAWLYSNFLHGEQGALLAASQLISAVPDTDAKFYAATQAMDEARHVEAYDRYLREKIGTSFPISPYLRQLLDELLRESRWDLKYLGMQILVEGLALAAFGFILQMSAEPLIRQIVQMIMQDEARHVAFGVLALDGKYDDMPPSELRDREDFIVSASRLMHDRLLGEEVWEHMGMPLHETLEVVRRSPSQQLFRRLLFSKIVPNVKRLGLLTPRVRAGFEELGVIEFEHDEPTA